MKARLAIGSVLAGILAVACKGSPPSSGPSPSQSTITAPPTQSPSPAISASLEEGRHFGYIKSVDIGGSPFSLVFDKADFLTGQAATEAAREDGVIGPDESQPNDYYIRNQNPLLRTLTFRDDVRLIVIDWTNCCETVTGELEPFAAAFEGHQPAGAYRGSFSPYWITVTGGEVVKVEEQYLP